MIRGRVIALNGEMLFLQLQAERISIKFNSTQSLKPISLGSWIELKGTWNGQSFFAEKIEILHQPVTSFPKPNGDWQRFHEQDSRRFVLVQKRSKIMAAIRSFFDAQDFLEIQTSSIVPNPGMDFHLDAFNVSTRSTAKWLITSPEYQMKRLLCAGFPKIFQIATAFRKEELGHQHQPEFTMLEWYEAFACSSSLMKQTQHLIQSVCEKVFSSSQICWKQNTINLQGEWETLTVSQAFQRFGSTSVEDILPNEDLFFQMFVEKIEPHLGFDKPVFLTHWPASMASLAQLHPQNPTWADRFELYIAGMELCNGFGELIDAKEQRNRFEKEQKQRKQASKDVYPIDEKFLSALEEGLPPCSGNALGIDRLVMLLTNTENIEDVVAFPHDEFL